MGNYLAGSYYVNSNGTRSSGTTQNNSGGGSGSSSSLVGLYQALVATLQAYVSVLTSRKH